MVRIAPLKLGPNWFLEEAKSLVFQLGHWIGISRTTDFSHGRTGFRSGASVFSCKAQIPLVLLPCDFCFNLHQERTSLNVLNQGINGAEDYTKVPRPSHFYQMLLYFVSVLHLCQTWHLYGKLWYWWAYIRIESLPQSARHMLPQCSTLTICTQLALTCQLVARR